MLYAPLDDPAHRAFLARDALAQLDFFRASLNWHGGFDLLDHDGRPIGGHPQQLHCTARMVHAYAMALRWGRGGDCASMVDAAMSCLWQRHRDRVHGGYAWAIAPDHAGSGYVTDGAKLAYGHAFVLLAASSAQAVGHDDAPRLLADIDAVIERHFWDSSVGRLREAYDRDWRGLWAYRGMNANMHAAEAMLAAFEVTGNERYLLRAGQILDFFTRRMAGSCGWRIPEHYTAAWQVDPNYRGDPVFRPAGTTPGHALEFARLALQHWDLSGRSDPDTPERARALVRTALADGWHPQGGLVYTLDRRGRTDISDRLWWPQAEAICALSALMKCDPHPEDAAWYERIWSVVAGHFIDHARGGWFPQIDAAGRPVSIRFSGKPDIYHALQADLLPLVPGLSRMMAALSELPGDI